MNSYAKAVRQNGDLWAYMLPRKQAAAHRAAEAIDSVDMLIRTSNTARRAPARRQRQQLDLFHAMRDHSDAGR